MDSVLGVVSGVPLERGCQKKSIVFEAIEYNRFIETSIEGTSMACGVNRARLLSAFTEHLIPTVYRYGELSKSEVISILRSEPRRSQKSYWESYCSLAEHVGFCRFDRNKEILVAAPVSASGFYTPGTQKEILKTTLTRFSYFRKFHRMKSSGDSPGSEDLLHPDERGIGLRRKRIQMLQDWYDYAGENEDVIVTEAPLWLASSSLYADKNARASLAIAMVLLAAAKHNAAVSYNWILDEFGVYSDKLNVILDGFRSAEMPVCHEDDHLWVDSSVQLYETGEDKFAETLPAVSQEDSISVLESVYNHFESRSDQAFMRAVDFSITGDQTLIFSPISVLDDKIHDRVQPDDLASAGQQLLEIANERERFALPNVSVSYGGGDLLFSIKKALTQRDSLSVDNHIATHDLIDRFVNLGSIPLRDVDGDLTPLGELFTEWELQDSRRLLQICTFTENPIIRYTILIHDSVNSIKRTGGSWIVSHDAGQSSLSELIGVLLKEHSNVLLSRDSLSSEVEMAIKIAVGLNILDQDSATGTLTVNETFRQDISRGTLGLMDVWDTAQRDIKAPLDDYVTE